MKRRIIILLTVLCLVAAFLCSVQAATSRLADEAGLLTADEAAALEKQLDAVSDRHGVDVVILTVDSIGTFSPMEFADDYYDYNGYGESGILLLVSMEERDWWISTAGSCITAFTDAGLEHISEQFLPFLSDGDYALAFESFVDSCDSFMTQAATGEPYDTQNLPEEPFPVFAAFLVSLVVGLVVALIVTGIMKAQLKSVAMKTQADDYVKNMELTNSRDLFLYSTMSRRPRPQSSSGGSSTHRGSSGVSHGGRGGKF